MLYECLGLWVCVDLISGCFLVLRGFVFLFTDEKIILFIVGGGVGKVRGVGVGLVRI